MPNTQEPDLIVEADLAAVDQSIGRRELLTAPSRDRRREIGPAVADMGADIEPGPVVIGLYVSRGDTFHRQPDVAAPEPAPQHRARSNRGPQEQTAFRISLLSTGLGPLSTGRRLSRVRGCQKSHTRTGKRKKPCLWPSKKRRLRESGPANRTKEKPYFDEAQRWKTLLFATVFLVGAGPKLRLARSSR